jgi:hypothetical protein
MSSSNQPNMFKEIGQGIGIGLAAILVCVFIGNRVASAMHDPAHSAGHGETHEAAPAGGDHAAPAGGEHAAPAADAPAAPAAEPAAH